MDGQMDGWRDAEGYNIIQPFSNGHIKTTVFIMVPLLNFNIFES